MMKERVGRTFRPVKRAIVMSMFVALMVVSVAAAALDSVTVDHYIIDLVEYSSEGDESIWVYAVTADADNPPSSGGGLSHWTLAVDPACCTITSPPDGATFNTRLDAKYGCGTTYNCTAAVYEVTHGADPTLNLYGIKFEHLAGEPLDKDNVSTHIFQFTVTNLGTTYLYDSGAGVKTGRAAETGIISGPTCGPTAVKLNSFSVRSRPSGPGIWAVISLLALSAISVGIVLLQRRRQIA